MNPPAQTATPTAIDLGSELTLQTVTGAHATLVEALRNHTDVVGHLGPDASVDLTGVQLLDAARRSARDQGGSFTLAEPAAGELAKVLTRGGFLASAEQRAFWLKDSGEL